MTDLKRLADELTVTRGAIGNHREHWVTPALQTIGQAESILRSAAAGEEVGTEWPDRERFAATHNRDIAAARIAVADARANAERHRNDALQHAEACRTLAAERDAAILRVEKMQEVIDNAAMLYSLSSEKSRTADSMYLALRPMLVPGSWAAGNHSGMLNGSPIAAPVAENASVARQWSRTPPPAPWKCWNAFRSNVTGNYIVCASPTSDRYWIDTGDELFCPWQDGDKREDLPSLPNPDKSRDTVSGSPVKGPDLSKVGVFGPGCSPHPLDRATPTEPRQWRREYYADRKFWINWWSNECQLRLTAIVEDPVDGYAGFVTLYDDTWCLPHIEGDTEGTLPPLPTGSTPAATPLPTELTPAVSPCELVARLAEVIKNWASLPDPMMRSCVPDVDAIIAEARRETT